MVNYVLRRIAGLIPTFLAIVTISFFILRLAPGGPFDQEQTLAPAVRANLERLYGLDRAAARAVPEYLGALARGDFGVSLRERDFTVTELIRQGLPVSVTLGLSALTLALLGGIPAGIAAALWRRPPRRPRGRSAQRSGAGVAELRGGTAARAASSALYLHWLPVAGLAVRGAPLPGAAGHYAGAAGRCGAGAPHAREPARESLRTGFVRSARARGLGAARVLWRHALPPALLPVVSYLGPAVAFVVTGSLVVETVFGLPGTGRYLVQGAIDRDYPLVMGMIVVYALLTLVLNLLVDLALRLARPGRAPWLRAARAPCGTWPAGASARRRGRALRPDRARRSSCSWRSWARA